VIQFAEGAAHRLARRNAEFAWELARALAESALYLTSTVAYVAFGTVRERIAAHLIELASSSPSSHGRLEVHMTQQELADVVGSVREVVGRALKDFRDQGLIEIASSRISILDENRLREVSVCKAVK
jgi:CRP/FNR family transcriptional regulator